MPRYRVVLEFDHPGKIPPTRDDDERNPPQEWDWKRVISDDANNLDVSVYELQVVEEYVPLEMKHETTR